MLRNAPDRIRIFRTTEGGTDGYGQPIPGVRSLLATHSGRFEFLDADEIGAASGGGQTADASIRLPLAADVVDGDELELAQPRHPSVAGVWRITTLQPSRGHLRILVER